jgi:hypothetical protein
MKNAHKSLLSLLVGAAALTMPGLAGKTLNGSMIDVTDGSILVSNAANNGGQSRRYSTDKFEYSGDGLGIVWPYIDLGNSQLALIGTLKNYPNDPFLPKSYAGGFINYSDANFPGLENGDVLGGNVPGGFFGAFDGGVNGNLPKNGRVGVFNTDTQIFTPDEGELAWIGEMGFSGFTPYSLGSGSLKIDRIYAVPDASPRDLMFAGLAAIGAAGTALRRGRNYFKGKERQKRKGIRFGRTKL